MSKNPHIGSSFDDFLAEEGLLEDTTAVAIKRVIAWQLAQAMKKANIKKAVLADRMKTSRSSLDRLLDASDTGLTLDTLSRAAAALGMRVKIDLIQAKSKAAKKASLEKPRHARAA